MEQDTLEALQVLAHELNSIFDIQIEDVISGEDSFETWVVMFIAYCLGRGFTLDEFNYMLDEVFAGTNDRSVFIKTLFGESND